MPDFDINVYANGNLQSAVTDWLDPRALEGGAPTGAPSRLNPRTGHAEKRYAMTVGVECEFHAMVDGIEAPLDVDLDGRLFVPGCVEYPSTPLVFSAQTGRTSIQRCTPRNTGHYLLYIRRPAGGQMMIHFDAAVSP